MPTTYTVIRRALITEKGMGVKETEGTLVFEVAEAATKTEVKFLGSYPVAGEDGHRKRRAVTRAWRDAGAWLDGLRGQVRDESGLS